MTDPMQTPAARALRAMHAPAATAREREEAARQMMAAYLPWVKRHLRRWPRARPEDVEDAMSEAIRRFYDPRLLSINHGNPEAWLRKTFHNVLIDQFRRRDEAAGQHLSIDAAPATSDEAPAPGLQLADPGCDTSERVLQRDRLLRAHAAVALEGSENQFIFMEYMRQTPVREIARALGKSVGAVRQRMHEIRSRLRDKPEL